MSKYIQNILVQYGIQYCQNFDKDLINVQLVKGLIEIKDVVLKRNALQALHPGLEVGHGYVRHVQLTTNLLSIKTKPFVLCLDGIELVLKPAPNVRLSEKEIEELLKERFMAKLNKILLVQQLSEDEGDEEGNKKKKKKGNSMKSFVLKNVYRILKNLKVNLSNIHLRYEDEKIPVAIGFALKRLAIISVDQNGQETFFKENDKQIFKKIDIEQFQIYCNNQYISVLEKRVGEEVQKRSREEVTMVLNSIFYQQFQDPSDQKNTQKAPEISYGSTDPNANQTLEYPSHMKMETPLYLISPMSVSVVTVYNTVPSQVLPKFGANVKVSNLNFSFSSSQILSVLQAVQSLQQHQFNQKNVYLKPEGGYEENAQAWLRYAFITHQEKIELDKQLLQDNEYRDYIALYAQHYVNSRTKGGKNVVNQSQKKSQEIELPYSSNIPILCNSQEESQQMHLLHQILDDTDILTCRFIVNEILKDKNYDQLKQQNYQWTIDETTYQQLLISNKQATVKQQIQEEKDEDYNIKFELSAEMDKFQLMFNSIVAKPKNKALTQTLSDLNIEQNDITKGQHNAHQKTIFSIAIGQPQETQSLAVFNIIQVQTKLTMFASGDMHVQGDLVDIEIYNLINKDIQYPVIFRKFQANPVNTIMTMHQISVAQQQSEKFINFQFSKLKEKNITAFNLHIDPMLLVVSNDLFGIATAVKRELNYFNEQTENNTLVNEIKSFSGEQWKRLKEYSEKSINDVIANHKEIDLFINIQSPVIVIPAPIGKEEAFCIVNFGKLRIKSDNQSQEELKNSVTMSSDSQNQGKPNVYDTYEILFTDTSIFVSVDKHEIGNILLNYQQFEGKELENQLRAYTNNIILQPTNVQVQFYYCFVKNYVDVPQMKASVSLGKIGVCVSENNVILLLKIVNYFTTNGLVALREFSSGSQIAETQKVLNKTQKTTKSRLEQHNAAISAVINSSQNGKDDSETETSTIGTATNEYLDELQRHLTIQQICKYTKMLINVQLDIFQVHIFAQSIRTQKNEQLLLIRLENAQMVYDDHPYHKVLQVKLSNFSVFDNVKKLDFINSKFEQDLFTMTATKMNKKHPEYIGIKNQVTIALHGLNVFYEPFFIHDVMFLANLHMSLFKQLQEEIEEKNKENISKTLKTQIQQKQQIENTAVIKIEQNRNNTQNFSTQSAESSLSISQLEEYDTELYEKAIYYFIDKQQKYQQMMPDIEQNFSLNVVVDELNLHLCKIGTIDSFVQTKLKQTTFSMVQYKYYNNMKVKTQGIEIFDNYKNTKYNYFVRMPEISNQDDITVTFSVIDPRSQFFQGYSFEISVLINVQLQITVMYRFIQQVREYLVLDIQDNVFSQAINEKLQQMKNNIQESIYNALNYKKQQRRPPSFMRLTVNAIAPAIRIPVNDNRDQYFTLDLGRLSIEQNYSVGIQKQYIDNINYAKIPVNQMIIKLSDVSINLINSSFQNKDFPVFNDKKYLFAPNNIIIALYTLVESNKTAEAQISGKLPSIAIHVQIDKKIQTQLDTETYDTLISLVYCQNNFGFSTVDSCNYTNADLIKLKQEIADLKIKLQQHLPQEQVRNIIKNNFSPRDQQALSTLHTLGSQVVSSNQLDIINPEIQNINVMTLYISVAVPQLNVTLSGNRGIGQHPIPSSMEVIALTVSGCSVQFNKCTLTQSIFLQLQNFKVQDLRISETSQKFSYILSTNDNVTVQYNADNNQQTVEISCPSVVHCNLVFDTIRYISSYFISPYNGENVKTKQIRQKKLQMKSKYDLLNKYLSFYKQLSLYVENELTNSNIQLINKISSTQIMVKVALLKDKPTNIQRNINVSLPCFNVYIPEDFNDEKTKILLASLQLNTYIIQKITVTTKLNENQQKQILDRYESNTQTTISAAIKNLEVKIISKDKDQTILSNLNIGSKIILMQIDKLNQHQQKQQFIAREKDLVLNILLESPVIFKITYQEINFFLAIIKQIQNDSLIPHTHELESSLSSPNQQSKETTSVDLELFSGTMDIGGVIKSKNNELTIKEIQFQKLVSLGIIPEHIQFNYVIQNEQFAEPIVILKNDMKLYVNLDSSLVLGIIDDRSGYSLLFEMKLTKLCFNAAIEQLTIPGKNKMIASLEISVQLCSYLQQQCEWEPVIEKLECILTIEDIEQRNIVIDVPEKVQINITPNIIQNGLTIMEIVNDNYINQTRLQNDIPFYQKLTDIEEKFIQLNKNELDNAEDKQNVRENMFKQYHVYNASENTILILLKHVVNPSASQVNNEITYTIKPMDQCYFDIESDIQAYLTIQEVDNNIVHFNEINFQRERYKALALTKNTIYMKTSIIDRQTQITFRPKIMIRNQSYVDMILSMNGTKNSLNHNDDFYINQEQKEYNIEFQLLEQCNKELFILKQFDKMPITCQISDKYFRIEQDIEQNMIDVIFYPTYIIRNDCIIPITINDQRILPLQQQCFYTNPQIDFIINNISDGQYSLSNVKLSSKRKSKIKSVSISSCLSDQQIYKEQKQTDLLYDFTNSIVLRNQSKQERTINILREFQLKANALNQFQHALVLYHQCVVRNMLATEGTTDCETAVISIKNTSKNSKVSQQVQLHVGERSIMQAAPSDKLTICVDYKAPNDRVGSDNSETSTSSYELKLQGPKINIPVNKNGLSYVLNIEESKNKLTQVLTVLPRYVIKNKTDEVLGLYFCQTNQFERQAHYFTLDATQQPKSCMYSGSYIFIQKQGQTSSAIPVNQQGIYYLEQFEISIHVQQFKEINFITLSKDMSPPILIKNETKREVIIKQKFVLNDMKKYKKQNIVPSIFENQNKPLRLQPGTEDGFYLPDNSIPPFLTVNYKKTEIPINTQLMGRRKPYTIDGPNGKDYLFVRVYCKSDQIIIQLCDKTPETFLHKKINETTEIKATDTLSIIVQDVSISIFQTLGEAVIKDPNNNKKLCTVKDIPVELYSINIQTLQCQNINLLNSNFKTLSIEQIKIANMQQNKDEQFIFQFLPDKTPNCLEFKVEKEKGVSQRIYKIVQINFGQAILNIDQSFYDSIKPLIAQYVPKTKVLVHQYDESLMTLYVNQHLLPSYPTYPQNSTNATNFMYMHYLNIDQINVSITLQLTYLDQQFGILSTLFNVFGSSLLQLKDAKINLRSLTCADRLWRENEFITEIRKYYTLQAMQNVFNVLKASFIFGSLLSAARVQFDSLENVSAARDAAERLDKLGAFGKNTVSSYFSVISATTTMLTNVTLNLAFDKAAMARRSQQLRESRKSTSTALINAFKAPTFAMGDAVTGLFARPVRAAQESGAAGAFKAVGQGLAGVVAKPVTGLIDFFSHLAIAAETGIRDKSEQIREQRVYLEGIIQPISEGNERKEKSDAMSTSQRVK